MMHGGMINDPMERIAEALERMSPLRPPIDQVEASFFFSWPAGGRK